LHERGIGGTQCCGNDNGCDRYRLHTCYFVMPHENGNPATCLFVGRVFDRVETVGLQAKQVPRLQHVGWQGRADIDDPAARMGNDDAARQKMKFFLQASGQLPVFPIEIFGIANDGMVNMGHVRA